VIDVTHRVPETDRQFGPVGVVGEAIADGPSSWGNEKRILFVPPTAEPARVEIRAELSSQHADRLPF